MLKKILPIILVAASLCFSQTRDQLNNQFLLGQSFTQAGQYEKAKPIFEKLYEAQPGNYQYFQKLNEVYIHLKEYNSSIHLINNKISNSSGNINLYGLLGTTYYLMGNEQKAFSVWDDALKKFPHNEMNYRVMANYAIERRAFNKAIKYLEEGKKVSSNPIYFSYDLANLYAITMQFTNATEEYCFILTKQTGQLRNIENRILNYINKPDALSKTLKVVQKYADDNVNFKYLLARLYLEDKNYEEAFHVYLQIDKIQNNQGAELFNFAKFLYGEKVYKTASKVYDVLLSKYPNSPFASQAKLGYAKSLEAILDEQNSEGNSTWKPFYKIKTSDSSEIEKVISAYTELTKLYPHSEVANESFLRIAEIKLNNQNDLNSAEEYLHRIVDDSPMSKFAPKAFEDLGEIYLRKGNLDSSAVEFSKVIHAARSSKENKNYANYRLARIDFYKGNFSKAKAILNKIISDLKDNNANDALEMSMLLNTSRNDSSNLVKFAHAELLTEQKKFKEAESKFKEVAGEKTKFMLQNLSELRNAEMELAMNNLDSAVVLLNKIVDEGDANIYADKALYLEGKIYQFGLNQINEAVKAYEKLLAKFPNSLYLDEARVQINKLKDKLS